MFIEILKSTIFVVHVQSFYTIPLTITLKSEAVTRKIEFSTDGGVEFFEPPIAAITATMLVVVAGAPITHVRCTGIIDDTLLMVD